MQRLKLILVAVLGAMMTMLVVLEFLSRYESIKHYQPLYHTPTEQRPNVAITGDPIITMGTPDFASFTDVNQKKQAFFSFFKPMIESQNQKILSLRSQIESDELNRDSFLQLCSSYRVQECTKANLLKHVDLIPESMVLAQAAIESAWGTSRFAREANNYFGQWCFTQGCGLVPSRRSEGASHEVKVFSSAQHAVAGYFKNINSHPAYEPAREIRLRARLKGELVKGSAMVGGLLAYSGIGERYIDELRGVIRHNNLES